MARVNGTAGNDFIHVAGDGRTPPAGANDIPSATDEKDRIDGGLGDDTIFGGKGNDAAFFNVLTDGADEINLGRGDDRIDVDGSAGGATEVRLTFTSSEVGNGNANDSGTLPNQDGGLAVRLQAEDGSDGLTGPVTRADDEGVTFVGGDGVTFDVRDLVSGAARGSEFEVVTLGTVNGDVLRALDDARPTYINGGMGDDNIRGGSANDFLVGGAGADALSGRLGDDSFIGGGGDDVIKGARGDDTAIHTITTDGADQIDLGAGGDNVVVNASVPTEVRLTFTSAEVGNGSAADSNTMAGQDGGLAVRMQAEDGSDGLTGPVTRVDDEGITFTAGPGVTFDVRDLASGVARGDEFQVVKLGTEENNTMFFDDPSKATYVNAGAGNDLVIGGNADDFLVGGLGDDKLNAGLGTDSMIGGAGADTFAFTTALGNGGNVDLVVDFSVADDTIELGRAAFAKIGRGDLDADAFTIGTAATDGDHRIIYDQATGSLFYDRDGSGDRFGAVEFAKLTAGLNLSEDDFRVV